MPSRQLVRFQPPTPPLSSLPRNVFASHDTKPESTSASQSSDSRTISQGTSTDNGNGNRYGGSGGGVLNNNDSNDDDSDSEQGRGDGEYAEEDNDPEYMDSGRPLSPSETPPPRRGNQRCRSVPPTRICVRFTPADHDAMVQFLMELGRQPIAADWEIFRNLTLENQVRSADAWRRKFSKDREILLADVLHLKAWGA